MFASLGQVIVFSKSWQIHLKAEKFTVFILQKNGQKYWWIILYTGAYRNFYTKMMSLPQYYPLSRLCCKLNPLNIKKYIYIVFWYLPSPTSCFNRNTWKVNCTHQTISWGLKRNVVFPSPSSQILWNTFFPDKLHYFVMQNVYLHPLKYIYILVSVHVHFSRLASQHFMTLSCLSCSLYLSMIITSGEIAFSLPEEWFSWYDWFMFHPSVRM